MVFSRTAVIKAYREWKEKLLERGGRLLTMYDVAIQLRNEELSESHMFEIYLREITDEYCKVTEKLSIEDMNRLETLLDRSRIPYP